MRKKRIARRWISLFLSALLLLGDGSALTAAASQENIPGKASDLGGTLSGNNPGVSDSVNSDAVIETPGNGLADSDSAGSDAVTETPGNDPADFDSAGSDTVPAVSGNDPALTVSGGDAAGLVRLPERFYKEERPETYGTLVSYDEYSRTYHVEGNRYVTVVGNDGATFVDEDGSLRPVDNMLVREDASLFGLNHMEDTGYTNRANDYNVLLPKDLALEEGKGITIANREAAVILYPGEGSFRDGQVKDNAIRYSNVFPGIDYQYTVLGNSVKEDIILLERGEKNSFTYHIDPCGLSGEIRNNALYLYEPGADPESEAAFVLEAPEMTDSAGEVSFGVAMTMEEREGLFSVTVTADKSWLEDAERVYPVHIDPTAVQVTGSAIHMACAEEGSPNTVIGDNAYPYVGYDDGITSGNLSGFGTRHKNCRTYFAIDYDFPGLSEEAEIVSATFQVTQKTRWSKGKSEFGLYGVEEPWEVRRLTWNNQLGYTHYFLDAQKASTERGEPLSFDVTQEVSAWINGTAPNHGLVMKAQVEAPNAEAAAAGVKMQCEVFYNNASARYAPRLVLSWTGEAVGPDALGLDDTTIDIYPVAARNGDKSTTTLGVVAHGLAQAGSTVHYSLINGTTGQTEAETELIYPDSALYQGQFPGALEYQRRLSNWQSQVFTGLVPGQVYYIEAYAEGIPREPGTDPSEPVGADPSEGFGVPVKGATVRSDTFLIYREGAFDLIPRIAQHYGVETDTILGDMRMQDTLTKEGNLLFIRSPQNTAPYERGELSDYYKATVDGLLLGRARHCVFGYEPVNLNTGNFYMEQTDVSIADIGGDFAFTRSYNSRGAGYRGSLGCGWSTPFDERLGELADGTILWLSGTGGMVAFAKTAEGYQAPAGCGHTLAAEGDGYVLTEQESLIKHLFNAYGMLVALEDLQGNRTTLSYDMDLRLSAVTSPSGKTCSVTLDEKNRITALGLPDGHSVRYTYDETGDLVKVTDPAGDACRFVYDQGHLMTAWYDENGHQVVENSYDGLGRVTEQKDAEGGVVRLSYQDGPEGGHAGNTRAVDANGNETLYTYDTQGRTTSVKYPDGTEEIRVYNESGCLAFVTDRQGTTISYTYDEKGNVLHETRQDGAVRSHTYTESGQPAVLTEYDGGRTVCAYDEKNRLTSVTDAEGGVMRYDYDEQNRLVRVTDARGTSTCFTYEGACATAMTDGEGGVWRFEYDAMNRLISATDPLGRVTMKTYDAKGRCIGETDGAGNSTLTVFDGAGAVTAITDREGQTSTFVYDKKNQMLSGKDPLGNTLAYTYDGNGNHLTETDAEGGVTAYAYDAMNRLTQITDPEGGVISYTYDGADRVTAVTDRLGHTRSCTYDVVTGGLLSETDARGNVTAYETDVLGRVTGITYTDGSRVTCSYDLLGRITAVTNQLGVITRLTYDANGNLIRIREGEDRDYTYTYDALNRLVQSRDPLGGTVRYAYDRAGNLISVTDELGNTTGYNYDAAGRLTALTDALGGTMAYTYDREGRVLSKVTPEGRKTTWTYDAIGQLKEMQNGLGNRIFYTYDRMSRIIGVADEAGSLSAYAYDKNGVLLQETDALGNTHVYLVDGEGNLLSDTYPNGEQDTCTYLETGKVSSFTDRYGVTTTFVYDALGRITEASDTAGNRMANVYDAAGNLVKQTDVLGRTAVYEYDAFGRLTAFTDVDGARTEYAYDALDRVTAVTDPAGNVTSYVYDGVGNLVGKTLPGEAASTYTYDALNRLSRKTDPEGAVTTFAYDRDGSLTSRTDGNGVQTGYAYDALGRLTAYTDGNGGVTAYNYDNRGNRISVTTPEGITELYGYDAVGNLLSLTNGEGETWHCTYDNLYRLVRQISPLGAEETYTYDRHDQITSVTDPLGAVTLYTVNANRQVEEKTLPNGGSYRYAYDLAHRLIGLTTPLGYETVFTYSEGNDIIKEEDSLGRTTFYAYDVLHNLVSATDPEGGVTSYTYDIRSNRTAVTNALGDTFAYAYDRADRLTAVTDPEQKTASVVYDREGNIESITMPGGRTTRYGYDGNYNVKTVMDPKGYEYAYTYDRDDRLTGILDPLGQTVGYTYDRAGRLVASQDKLGRRESYLYDAQGSLLSHTWGEGLTVAYAYDRKGRPVSLTDPMGNTALYGWDVMDNLTSVTDYLGRTTAYTYDLEDNLTSVTGPMGRKETLSYDMASRLAAYTTNGGNTVTYDYDKLDSLAEKAYADAAGKESAAQVDYTYDALGRRTAMEDSTGDTLYTYDALGRLTAVTLCRRPGKSADAAFSREPDQCDTVGYLYDGADRLAAVTYPDGTRVSYEYDLNDNPIKVVGRRGEETVYEYDALNRPVAEHRPDGISTYKSYSAEDQVLTLTNRCDACGWVLGHYSYEYDAAGRLTAEHTQEARERDPYGRQPHDLYAPEQTNPGCSHGKDSTLSYRLLTTDRAYTYDGAGKLLEVTETEGTCGTTSWRYTYDAMGNLTLEEKKNPVGKVVESNRYRYNEDNQLTEAFLCDGRSSRKVVYTYDEDGNLIGEASPSDNSLTTYRYTVEARLEAVYTGTAYNRNLLMAAAYDGDGNRVYQLNYNPEPDEDFSDYYCSYSPCDYNGTGIRLRAAGEVSPAEEALIALVGASGAVTDSRYELMEYINDVNREYAEVLVEQNINGRIDTVYTYGRERLGREMFGQERRTSYYLYDPRGSVSGLTDGEGRLTGTYRYTATGELSHGGARYENEYTYNGESYNPNVECQYLRARYYSVARGSFLTQDSYLGELWQPLSWNRYNYCVSSWSNYRDPSGHVIAAVPCAVVGGVGGLVIGIITEVGKKIDQGDNYNLTEGLLNIGNTTVSGIAGGAVFGSTGNPMLAGMAAGGSYGFLDGTTHLDSRKGVAGNFADITKKTLRGTAAGGLGGAAVSAAGGYIASLGLSPLTEAYLFGGTAGAANGTATRLLNGSEVNLETVAEDYFTGGAGGMLLYGINAGYNRLAASLKSGGNIRQQMNAAKESSRVQECEGGEGSSLADMMSPEDAIRYQRFQDNGSTAGLTPEELLGIQRVDDYLALNRVNYGEVLAARNSGVINGRGTQINGTSYDVALLRQTQPYIDRNEVNGLAEYIAANGPNSVDPILVRVHEGKAYIVDGHHRYNAFLKLGYDRVPIKYLHNSDLGKMLPDGTYLRPLEDILAGAELCK